MHWISSPCQAPDSRLFGFAQLGNSSRARSPSRIERPNARGSRPSQLPHLTPTQNAKTKAIPYPYPPSSPGSLHPRELKLCTQLAYLSVMYPRCLRHFSYLCAAIYALGPHATRFPVKLNYPKLGSASQLGHSLSASDAPASVRGDLPLWIARHMDIDSIITKYHTLLELEKIVLIQAYARIHA